MPRFLPLLCAFIAFVATACGGKSDEEARVDVLTDENINPPGVTISMCGVVDAYAAPDGENSGTLSIDGRVWSVLPRAEVSSGDLLVAGRDVCFSADLDPSLRIERATVTTGGE